jgi:hypothetical protein
MLVPISLVIYLSCAFLLILGLAIWMLEREREAHYTTGLQLDLAQQQIARLQDAQRLEDPTTRC